MKTSALPPSEATTAVLVVEDLSVTLLADPSLVRIVDGVDLTVGPGEVVGLVGESGSGKSLTCLAAMDLLGPALHRTGRVQLAGEDWSSMSERRKRQMRGTVVSMIFQEPMSSLNPVLPVGVQMREALHHRGIRERDAIRRRSRELLGQVGINNPTQRLKQYPHELSGGMCQRVMIAIALAGEPALLIADEPTTALDVTIQAQILALLRKIVAESGMSLILVSHDLGVVAEVCERVCVMYGGRIIESGPVARILEDPTHPYTEALLRSVPSLEGARRRLPSIPGTVPTVNKMPSGCRFNPRCGLAIDRCSREVPPLAAALNEQAHDVACWVRNEAL